MNIVVLEQISNKHWINRDQMGGLGIGRLTSPYFFTRTIGYLKYLSIRLPNLNLPQICAYLIRSGHCVSVAHGE